MTGATLKILDKQRVSNNPISKHVLRDWLWPLLCPGVSYRQYWKLLNKLGSPEYLPKLRRQDAEKMQIDAAIVEQLRPTDDVKASIEAEIESSYQWLASASHHHLILAGDSYYPALLRELADPPPLLFAAGDLSALDLPSIALVGSRRCTPYGAIRHWLCDHKWVGAGCGLYGPSKLCATQQANDSDSGKRFDEYLSGGQLFSGQTDH